MKKLSNFEVGDFFKEKTGNFSKEPPSYIWDRVESAISPKFGLNMIKQQFLRNWGKISVIFATGVIVGGLSIYIRSQHQPISSSDQISHNSSSELIESDNSNNDIIETQINIIEEKNLTQTSEAKTDIIHHEGIVVKNKEIISLPELNNKSNKQSNEIITESDENKLLEENNESDSKDITAEKDSKAQVETVDHLNKSKVKSYYYLNISKIGKIKKITIIDDSGKEFLLMKSPKSSYDYLPIDISDIPNGKYILNILTEDNYQSSKAITID